jgi:Zn-dependent peptidase ImmA (M78 family)
MAFEAVSKDAFTVAKSEYEVETTFICFNRDINLGRLRQSIAHEIAHIWLEHPSSEEPFETEAEYFAAYLLAPIPLIIDNNLLNPAAVQQAFLTSSEAARISLRRAGNRVRCGKPIFEYEYHLVEMATLKGGDCFVGI